MCRSTILLQTRFLYQISKSLSSALEKTKSILASFIHCSYCYFWHRWSGSKFAVSRPIFFFHFPGIKIKLPLWHSWCYTIKLHRAFHSGESMNSERENGVIKKFAIGPFEESTEFWIWVVGCGVSQSLGFKQKNNTNNALVRFCLIM